MICISFANGPSPPPARRVGRCNGCASSSDPPEVYVNMMVTNQHGDKTPYLFDDVGDCCAGWFNDIYDDCVGDEERVTDMVQHVTENGNHYVEVVSRCGIDRRP